MTGAISVLLMLAVFFAYFVWQIRQRGLQARALAERGLPVTGEVVKKFSRRSPGNVRTRHLRYRFCTPDGHEYAHQIAVSSEEYEALEEGGPIELMYLADKPQISAMRSMVDLVRDNLDKATRNRS